jgi:4-amino-4-deoxy-L-arabinose transferase-like glycosyltransferase
LKWSSQDLQHHLFADAAEHQELFAQRVDGERKMSARADPVNRFLVEERATSPSNPSRGDLPPWDRVVLRLSGFAAGAWFITLSVAWVFLGLVGHDPWKPDEAHTFGVILDFLERGDWVAPMLAGEPFVEKPPLFIIVAGSMAHLLGGVLPLHDAARLATGLFVSLALLFLGLTGREIYGRRYGVMAVLVMIGCIGPIARLHQLVVDVALVAGVAIGIYGLALSRRSVWGGGLALGVGAGCAFLAKGLLGPGWLALTAIVLPVFPPWRTRRYGLALLVAAIVAMLPATVWMGALYSRSPPLFTEWLITNNFGRFFGFTRVGPHNASPFYALVLPWYAFPALPLAAWTIWTAWRHGELKDRHPGLALPLLLATVTLGVLALASDSRDLYLLPLLVPLSLLAAPGIDRLPALGTIALSQAARWAAGILALLLWVGWLALMTGSPSQLHAMLLAYQPGFVTKIHWAFLALALGGTALGVHALQRVALDGGTAVTQWTVATTLCWCLIATLWAPYLNAGKSYRTMIESLARELPDAGCVASAHLGEGQRGLLDYFAGVETVRLEVQPQAACSALLVQGWRDDGAPAPAPGWTPVWEGARPGDERELYRLYRRDVPAEHELVRFP